MGIPVDQNNIRRFVVLIPDSMAHEIALAHKIHWMAVQENLAVLFLVLVDRKENDLAVSLAMATMKAVTSGNRLLVDVQQTESELWLRTLHDLLCPGDVIVCLEEQDVIDESCRPVPISSFLNRHFDTPVQPISGLYPSEHVEGRNRVLGFLYLLGYLVIIAIFTWVQILLDQAFDGAVQKIFILFTFFVEVGAIWGWSILENR